MACEWRWNRAGRWRRSLIWGSGDLGIGHEALRERVRQAEADGGLRPDLPTSEQREEIRKLKCENAELRRANREGAALDRFAAGCRVSDDHQQRRLTRNEAIFRDVNEALERGVWPGEEQDPMRFRCECARVDCNKAVEVTARDYEQVRAHPRRFLLAEGHEDPAVEDVLYRHPGWVVVEKRGAAGAVAEETDPRAD